ncbi:GEVED domain-containing protein, partial [Streptococcus fryi]
MQHHKHSETKQRFTIKKFKVGAASVLIGTVFMAFANANQVQAAEHTGVTPATDSITAVEAEPEASESAAAPTTAEPETVVAEAPVTPVTPPVTEEPKGVELPAEEKAAETPEPVKPAKKPTVGYPVKPSVRPESSAMPVPENAGKAIPTGTGFRAGEQNLGQPYDPTEDNAKPRNSVPVDEFLATQPVMPESENLSKPNKFGEQIALFDFSAPAEGSLDSAGRIQVGNVFRTEIAPGYVIELKVKSLQPFRATEEYRAMAEKIDALNNTNYATTVYNPQATNANHRGDVDGFVAKNQETYFPDWANGFDNGARDDINPKNRLGSSVDGSDIGATFEVHAIVNGIKKPVDIFFTDGEQLTNREMIYAVTNGTNWDLLGELNVGNKKRWMQHTPSVYNDGVRSASDPANYPLDTRTRVVAGGRYPDGQTPNPQAYVNPNDNAGLGTKVIGGFYTYFYSYPGNPDPGANLTLSVPIFTSSNVTEFSTYINSAGKQSIIFGVIIQDRSDAPESYGEATHGVRNINQKNQERQVPQLGRVKADIDRVGDAERLGGFYGDDDKVGVENNTSSDEGERQLAANGLYEVVDEGSSSYTLNIVANANGPSDAYLNAWIDFNNDGVFQPNEAAGVKTISGANESTVALTWNNLNLTTLPDEVSKLALRVRIAGARADVNTPTGYAGSGEVEDSQVMLVRRPKGSKEKTTGTQGATQTADLTFTARGAYIEPNVEVRSQNVGANTIPAGAPVGIVDPTSGQLVQSYTEPGQGTYTISGPANNPTVTFKPVASFTGQAKGVVVRTTDANGKDSNWNKGDGFSNDNETGILAANWDSLYIPEVTPVTPTSENAVSEDVQGKPQSKTLDFGIDNNSHITSTSYAFDDGQTTKTVAGEGTYTIDPTTGQVTFTPEPSFTGTATPVTVKQTSVLTADDGTTTNIDKTATYTPTVTPVRPTAENSETTGKQGQVQKSPIVFEADKGEANDKTLNFKKGTEEGSIATIDPNSVTLLDANGSPATSVTVEGQGTYTIEDGNVVFTPLPEYTGPVTPVKVRAADTNGTTVEATYTPRIEPVTPTATPATTEDIQGQAQKTDGKALFTEGDPSAPINNTTIRLVNAEGQPVTELPALNAEGEQVGTYSVDEATGEITFQPNPDFVGTPVPAKVEARDANGTRVETTYTPTVTPVKPVGKDATSEGPQGVDQTGTPTFTGGDDKVPVTISADNPAKLIDPATGQPTDETTLPAKDTNGRQVGTYTIDPTTGEVTFKPNPDYTGDVPVVGIEVEAKDTNGTPATATYTPKVTPVVPTSEEAVTSDIQGKPQTAPIAFGSDNPADQENTVNFNEGDSKVPIDKTSVTLLNAEGEPQDVVEVLKDGKKVGTYTLTKNDQGEATGVVFTPEKDFTGEAPAVSLRALDENGTPTTTTYTPTVTPVTPTGNPAESTGIQGQPQTETPTFEGGSPEVPVTISAENPAKLVGADGQPTTDPVPAMKDGEQVGTYTIDPATGAVTFTPNPDFVGTPDPVKVQAKDTNGTVAETTYTPTVTPVTPTGTPKETTGIQGQPQEGTPTFKGGDDKVPVTLSEENPAKLVDPKTGEPTDEKTVPALDETGKEIGT